MMTEADLAKEADFLANHFVLVHALEEMRKDALEEIINTFASETFQIANLQAQVRAIDGFRDKLASYVMAAQPTAINRGLA